jgi:hypothetical protein
MVIFSTKALLKNTNKTVNYSHRRGEDTSLPTQHPPKSLPSQEGPKNPRNPDRIAVFLYINSFNLAAYLLIFDL